MKIVCYGIFVLIMICSMMMTTSLIDVDEDVVGVKCGFALSMSEN